MPDDFSADILTTGLITVNGTATGEIEELFDIDYFKVSLISGRIYAIELRGAETGDGTLTDPFLGDVRYFDDHKAADTMFVTGSNDNAPGSSFNSAAIYYAPYTGDYFLHASESSNLLANLGTYTLEITDLANGTTNIQSQTYLVGTANDDVISGLAGQENIFGLAGDDFIEGGDSGDVIVGGFGADTIFGGDGNDTIFGFNAPSSNAVAAGETDPTTTDVIYGGEGDDVINLGPGGSIMGGNTGYPIPVNNSISFGGAGDDQIIGTGAIQFIDGGTGADLMWGASGVTTYVVDDIGDVAIEQSYDRIGGDGRATGDIDEIRSKITWELRPWGSVDVYQIENLTLLDLNDSGLDSDDPSDNVAVNIDGTGNNVDNVITGNSGNNRLDGMEGPDTIIGGAGEDTIIGGVGDDSLTGGSGADQFNFATGDGDDVITDFEKDVDLLPTGWVEGTAAGVSSAVIGGNTVFTHGINDTVTLTGVVFPLPNANPVFTSIPPGPINEDEPFTFNFSASDPDGDPVSIVPGSLIIPSWIIAGAGLTGTPTQANVGTAGNEVSLTIQDGRGGTAIQSFIIEVLNVNDDPTFTTTAITTAQTGTVYTYTPLFADEDGDIPTVDLALSTIPNWITFNPVNGTFSGTPQESDAGLVGNDLIIVITDGIGGTATQTAAINVALSNQDPVFTSTPPLSTDEDALFSYQITATDPDSDPLSLTIDTLPSWVTVNQTGLVSGTPLQADVGSNGNDFSFSLSDGNGGTAIQTFTLNVVNVNDDPTFTTTPITTAQTGTVYTYTPLFADEDGDLPTVDLALSNVPSWLTFNPANGTFSGTPLQDDIGLVGNDLIIAIDDGMGGTATQTVAISVANSNQNPFFTSTPSLTANEDALFSYQISVDDPDNDDLDITFDVLPNWISVDENDLLSGTPLQSDVSEVANQFSFTVTDGKGGAATQSFTLDVLNVNDDPTGAVTIVGTPQAGSVLTADTSGLVDVDGLGAFSFQWTKNGLPLTLATQSTYTLDEADFGEIAVTVNYTDGFLMAESVTSASITFNTDPRFTPPALSKLTATQGEAYTYTAFVSDPDSDLTGIALTVDAKPDWLDFDPLTNTFSGSPEQGDVGELGNTITVTQTDGEGGSATQTFTIDVENVNDDPTGLVTITGTLAVGSTLTADTSALADADGLGVLSFQWTRDGQPIALATQSTYVLTGDDVGAIAVTASYTDGFQTLESVTSAPVNLENSNPVFAAPGADDLTATQNEIYTYTPVVDDVDSDLTGIALTVDAKPDWLAFDTLTNTFSGTPAQGDVGELGNTITVTQTDGEGGSATQTFTIDVEDVNDDPTGEVTVNGTFEIGGVLTADTSALGDIDGLGAFSYQWVREGGGVAILPSTTDTYVLTRDDAGQIIAVVSYTDGGGTEESVASTGIEFTPDPRIIGTSDPDSLVGTAGQDTLVGLEEDDTLDGGGGVDTLDGGPGNDLYLLDSAADSVFEYEDAGFDSVVIGETYTLPDHVEELQLRDTGDINGTGNGLDNALFGNLGANVLTGLAGNDTLDGAGGGDTLNGGSGDDLYVIRSNGDTLIELADGGLDRVESAGNLILGDNLENITLFGAGSVSAVGNDLDNHIIGNLANNALFGNSGDDLLEGRGGRDVLYDGNGNDTLIGGDDDDIYLVGDIAVTEDDGSLATDDDGNVIATGDVVIEEANGGIDTVISYGSSFVLPDHVENLLIISLVQLALDAENEIDTVKLRQEPDIADIRAPSFSEFDSKALYATEQDNINDIAFNASGTGNSLNNVIIGDISSNLLKGLDGADTIEGGKGFDTVEGGTGADIFVYRTFLDGGSRVLGNIDLIEDFSVADGDRIDLTALAEDITVAASNSAIGGLRTKELNFFGDTDIDDYPGLVTTNRTEGRTFVTVDSGSDSVKDLVFAVDSSESLTFFDFILDKNAPAFVFQYELDSVEPNFGIGAGYDYGGDINGAVNFAIPENGNTGELGGLKIGVRMSFGAALDQVAVINYDASDSINLKASFGSVSTEANDDFGQLGGMNGNGLLRDIGYDTRTDASPVIGRFILGHSYSVFDSAAAGSTVEGFRTAAVIADPTESLFLDIDRNLDGTKDFELELRGDYRDVKFRTEIVNGDIEITLHEGNSGPTGKLTINGTPRIFENLEANLDKLFDRDGIDLSTLTFQWFNNGVEIADATENEYRARLSDAGNLLNVQVTYTDFFGTEETVLSETSFPIGVLNLAAEGEVGITGALLQGETISVDVSDVTDRNVPDPRSATYQWQRDGVDIADATGFTYVLTQDDVGSQMRVIYTFTDFGGSAETKTSASTEVVENVNDAPRATITLFGVLQVDRSVSARIDLFDLDGIDTSVARTYQWFRDGTAIAGETELNYRVTTEDIQNELSVRIGYTDGFGTSEFATSTGFLVPLQGIRTIGTSAAELLEGSIGADQLFGNGGNDTLIGGASDDLFSGGSGIDTAVYSGNQSSYTVTLSRQGVIVEDRRSDAQGGEGTDTMTDISFLDFGEEIPEFAGGPMGLDLYSRLSAVSPEEFTAFVELYIAYFNRAPDAIGLFFWGSVLQLPDWDLERIAVEGFFPQDETQATYPDLTDIEGFAKKVYTNVLGRDFDQEGLDFWIGVLEGGFVSLPKFMLQIIEGAKVDAQPGASEEFIAQQAADVAYLANKAELGTYFSVIKGMSNVENSRAVMDLYDGSQASIDAAKASTDNFYADALDAENGEFLFSLAGVVDDPFAIF